MGSPFSDIAKLQEAIQSQEDTLAEKFRPLEKYKEVDGKILERDGTEAPPGLSAHQRNRLAMGYHWLAAEIEAINKLERLKKELVRTQTAIAAFEALSAERARLAAVTEELQREADELRKKREDVQRKWVDEWAANRAEAELLIPGIADVAASDRNRLIAFRYEQGFTLREVGVQFGLTGARIRGIHIDVMAKLAKALKRRGLAVLNFGDVSGRIQAPEPEWHDEQPNIEWTPKMQAQEFAALRSAP